MLHAIKQLLYSGKGHTTVGRRLVGFCSSPSSGIMISNYGTTAAVRKLQLLLLSVQQPPLRIIRPFQNVNIRSMVIITQSKGNSGSNKTIIINESTDSEGTNQINSLSMQQQQQQQQLDTTEEMSVTVTESCYERIRYLIAQKKKKKQNNDIDDDNDDNYYYLRVFVDAGGCSGFTYQFELDTETNLNPNEDVVFMESSTTVTTPLARVVIDRGSLSLLSGSKIDYVQEMIKSTFEVRDNPQSESACGCGSSFAVKNFNSNPAID